MLFKTLIIEESNAAPVRHRLGGAKSWEAMLGNPTYAAGMHVGLRKTSEESQHVVYCLERLSDVILKRKLFSDSSVDCLQSSGT